MTLIRGAALLALLSGAAQAQSTGRIAFDTYALPNGLRVVFSEDHSAPVVTVNVWYHVGSANEVTRRSGFAHLFEHMMFQGSANVRKAEHFQLIERAGGDMNGTTNDDRTNYYETLPSNRLNLGLWLEADRAGTYKGQCFEFCGDGHADMLLIVVAHPKNEYAAWAQRAVAEADLFLDPATQRGSELFKTLACAGCHKIEGLTAGTVGPELTHIASKANIAGVLSPVNEENLTRWIQNPPAVKPGTAMPALGLDAETIDAIVKFLLTRK